MGELYQNSHPKGSYISRAAGKGDITSRGVTILMYLHEGRSIFFISHQIYVTKMHFFLFLLSNSMIKSNINCLPEIINYLIKIT